VIGKLAKKKHDRPRRLRIETGSRFVEEDEESGLGSEFYTDSETFPLFDVETHPDFSDQSFGVSLHFEEFDDFFHVFEFLGLGSGTRLAEESTEDKRLTNSRSCHVSILLLAVTGLTLERDR
jgi:hypothetical protein